MKGVDTMSAIAGIMGAWELSTAEKMLHTMKHRGPDKQKIIDLPEGCLFSGRLNGNIDNDCWQSVTLGNRQFHLVWDGELYHADSLRRELSLLGHQFVGHSHGEVLLHAYAQWGEDCAAHLNGIYAFAIWDDEKKLLFLARDPIGVKPLFFWKKGGLFVFASEIKTLLAHPSIPPQVDAQGVGEILLLGPGRTPGCGVFHDIQELEPGCCATLKDGSLKIRRYWCLEDHPHEDTLPQTLEKIRYLVTDSIKCRLDTSGSVCTFLSGGLDSSLISSVVSKMLAENGQQLPTFSVTYKDNDKYFTPGKFQPNSDTPYISMMENYLGCQQHLITLDTEALADALDEAVEARDLPGMADVDASLLLLCKAVKPYADIALSGECADEIFGGYPWYRDPAIRSQDGFPWAQSTKWRSRFLTEPYRSLLDPQEFIDSRYKATCRSCHIMPGQSEEEQRIKELVNLNFRWFMQTLLDRNDRMSMWSGLKVRVPYCDIRIAEYLYTVPWSMKDLDGFEKGLLRKAAEGLLPQKVLWRKKSPYPKTHNPAYLALVQSRLKGILDQGTAPIFQLVDRTALEDLLSAQYPWPWYGQLMNTPQTIAYMLSINHWMEHYHVELI